VAARAFVWAVPAMVGQDAESASPTLFVNADDSSGITMSLFLLGGEEKHREDLQAKSARRSILLGMFYFYLLLAVGPRVFNLR
jgi:hypothetical protein